MGKGIERQKSPNTKEYKRAAKIRNKQKNVICVPCLNFYRRILFRIPVKTKLSYRIFSVDHSLNQQLYRPDSDLDGTDDRKLGSPNGPMTGGLKMESKGGGGGGSELQWVTCHNRDCPGHCCKTKG